jgi:hypothetical protein
VRTSFRFDLFLARRGFGPLALFAALLVFSAFDGFGQAPQAAAVKLGSQTAKNGFRNEDEIKDKFINWRTDTDANSWLTAMGYSPSEITEVSAIKPHGEKADVELRITTRSRSSTEGISIKLVSGPNGFNQIDKRWLSHYSRMWKMPASVEHALKLFLGELPPTAHGRDQNRMFLNELEKTDQEAIVRFFSENKDAIVSDLFEGDGAYAAGWIMVAFKATDKPAWSLRRTADAIRFYSEGPVAITSRGNLKIGRITMQRKGGDAGRDSARMLQFKINPVELFDLK